MPSTDHPTANDILISFDPLINDNGAIVLDSTQTESKGTLPANHVNAILEDGSLAQLTMSDLQSLPISQRYCHIEDTYYILPNYVTNKNVEVVDVNVPTPTTGRMSFISRLRTKFRSNSSDQPKRLFGVPLDALSPFPPPFLATAFTCILQNPLEGVYRLSAAASAVTKATNRLNNNPSDDNFLNVVDEEQTPILAAALVKAFIRQIPGGLLSSNHALLADAIKEFTEHSNENKLLTLLHSLPHRNAIMTRQLFDHLNTLLAFSESTKMTSANLATCMGPNLFSDFALQDQGRNSMDAAMAMAQLGTSLAKWLICDAHRVFDELPPLHYIAAILKSSGGVEWIDYGDATRKDLDDILLVQQFPLFTKPPERQVKDRIENAGGYYMSDLIEIDPFADSDRPPLTSNDAEGEESFETDCDQSSGKDSVKTESEYIHENTGERDTPLDPIEEACTQDESRSDSVPDARRQEGIQGRGEIESNPWEESSIPQIISLESVSLERLGASPPEHESVEGITTMSEPGQPFVIENSPEV